MLKNIIFRNKSPCYAEIVKPTGKNRGGAVFHPDPRLLGGLILHLNNKYKGEIYLRYFPKSALRMSPVSLKALWKAKAAARVCGVCPP